MRYSGAAEAGQTGTPGERAGRDDPAGVRASTSSLSQLFMSLLNDIPGLVSDRVQLLALELRRARQSFVRMALLVLVAAILAATAWAAFWAFAAAVVVALGMPWYGVFALIFVLNCFAAWLAIRSAQALVGDLTLPATLRRLTLAPSPTPAPGATAAGPAEDDLGGTAPVGVTSGKGSSL